MQPPRTLKTRILVPPLFSFTSSFLMAVKTPPLLAPKIARINARWNAPLFCWSFDLFFLLIFFFLLLRRYALLSMNSASRHGRETHASPPAPRHVSAAVLALFLFFSCSLLMLTPDLWIQQDVETSRLKCSLKINEDPKRP